MTLKEYLAEVKQRAEYASGREWQDHPVHESQGDVPRLIAIVEAQAEALEFYANYMGGDNPEFTKSGWLKYPSPKIAKEALAKAEAIAGGER